jgi:hypothetical protein
MPILKRKQSAYQPVAQRAGIRNVLKLIQLVSGRLFPAGSHPVYLEQPYLKWGKIGGDKKTEMHSISVNFDLKPGNSTGQDFSPTVKNLKQRESVKARTKPRAGRSNTR